MPTRSYTVTAAIPITMAGRPRPVAESTEVFTDTLDLEALIARHQAGLWRYVRALGAEIELADDVVQDAFLTAWRTPPSIPFANAKAWMGWLRTVARNRFITVRRREKKQVSVGELEEVEALFASLSPDGSSSWLIALESCFGSALLDERSRKLLEMRYRDEMSAREVAAALSMSETNVGVTAHRALAKLRVCVERRLGHD